MKSMCIASLKRIVKRSLVMAVVAVLTASGQAQNLVLCDVQTTVYSTQDMDTNRPGLQVMYEWRIRNQDPPAGEYWEDALWKVTIGTDLAQRGMYGFDDNDTDNFKVHNYPQWSSSSDSGNYSWFANLPGNEPIHGADAHYFRALVDADQIIGQETSWIQGLANNGPTQVAQITVPISLLQKTSNGTPFSWLKDNNLVADTNNTASYDAAAQADTDGDGFDNGQEYIADSDPNNSNSFFRITVADSAMNWHSATGRVYTVKGTTSLTNTFSVITNFTGIAGNLTYSNLPASGFSFFRLTAELE
jgi:hypothetical protein